MAKKGVLPKGKISYPFPVDFSKMTKEQRIAWWEQVKHSPGAQAHAENIKKMLIAYKKLHG